MKTLVQKYVKIRYKSKSKTLDIILKLNETRNQILLLFT